MGYYARYTNWQKAFIGGTDQYTNIHGDISGGNTNTQFLLGGGYNHQTTVYPGNYGDTKGSAHLSLTHTSGNQKFHAQFTADYISDNNYIPATDFTKYIALAPDAPPLYSPNGSINWQMYNGSGTFNNNPIALTNQKATSVTSNLMSSLNLSYQLMPGLLLSSNFGFTNDETSENLIFPSASYNPPLNTNPSVRENEISNSDRRTWIVEPQLSYNKKIAKGQLSMLIGTTFQQNISSQINDAAYDFPSDALINNPAAASGFELVDNAYTLYRYNAVYSRIGYNWDDEYLLNITGRRDGSSRFGPGYQFGNFGSIGAGWIFSKERFVQDNVSWLNFGKLRLSYGTTGNDQISDYQFLSTYASNSSSYQGVSALYPTGLTNQYFHWEEVKKLEIGLELGFLKDRIHLEASYYRDRDVNQLVGEPLSQVTGFGTIQYNLPATVQNSGLELNLNSVNVKSSSFSWHTSLNFSLPYNKLISYQNLSNSAYAHTYVIGKSIFIKSVPELIGVNSQTGVLVYTTQNLNGVPASPKDYVFSEPITRTFYGGLTNTFRYKNLSLDIFAQFEKQLGYNFLQYWSSAGAGYFDLNEPTYVLSNSWQYPGDISLLGKYSTKGAADPRSLLNRSNAAISDASFIRIKNVALSYNLPQHWQQWAHIQNARIFIQGQNLFTITKYLGLDPETHGLSLPPLRVITTGINASF